MSTTKLYSGFGVMVTVVFKFTVSVLFDTGIHIPLGNPQLNSGLEEMILSLAFQMESWKLNNQMQFLL